MSGMTVPAGVMGASVVLGNEAANSALPLAHVAQATLPFTGISLGVYLAVGVGLVLTGLVLRLLGRTETSR